MTGSVRRGYHHTVPPARSGAWRRTVAGALLWCTVFGRPHAALADSASFKVDDQAVVQVIGRMATITIRTWNRNTVRVDWPGGELFEPSRATQETRSSFLIPTVAVDEYATPTGSVRATLLPEDFPVPNLTPGMHDVVRIKELEPADHGKSTTATAVTVTIPASTGLVNVRTSRGAIILSGYRGTTIAASGRGRIVLRDVGGDAFVQPLNGRFYAFDSAFERLRIRSNRADQVFDACSVKQIEATTLTGNIIFDNGVFNPGLARFESDRGSIALGVNGGAQLGAHTQDGRVVTVLPVNQARSIFEDDAQSNGLALVGNGGPLVNASSVHGNVFLYDGSLTDRRPAALGAEWHPMYDLLVASRAAAARWSARANYRGALRSYRN